MATEDEYNDLVKKINQETQIEVSFKTKDLGETIPGQIQKLMGKSAEVEFAVVEMPHNMLADLCHAALLGVMSAAAMGLPNLPVQAPDGSEVDSETLKESMTEMFSTPMDAIKSLSSAMMAATSITSAGFERDSAASIASFAEELDAIPTYEGKVTE